MIEYEERRTRGIQRYCLTSQRTFSLSVIAFDQLKQADHVARIVDLSVVGVGIETSEQLETGLVYFNEQVGGHRFGVVNWSRQDGDRYRAGITFVVLPQKEEEFVRQQVAQPRTQNALRDPEKIIASLLTFVKNRPNS